MAELDKATLDKVLESALELGDFADRLDVIFLCLQGLASSDVDYVSAIAWLGVAENLLKEDRGDDLRDMISKMGSGHGRVLCALIATGASVVQHIRKTTIDVVPE